MQDPDNGFLGKRPKRSDARTLQLPALSPHPLRLPVLVTGQTGPQPAVDNQKAVPGPWDWLGNDRIRDCTCAAAGHAETLWTALYGGHLPEPTVAQITHAYSEITHYQADDDSTDTGADLLSVLKYWQRTGIANRKIRAFAEIPVHDIGTLKWSIACFGVAYVGLRLPSACVAQGNRQFTARRKMLRPASWANPGNGHCVIYTGYDAAGQFTCVTWNRVMTVPAEFHHAYCDEAYAVIPPAPDDPTAPDDSTDPAGSAGGPGTPRFAAQDQVAGRSADAAGPRQALAAGLDQLTFLDAALDRATSVPRR